MTVTGRTDGAVHRALVLADELEAAMAPGLVAADAALDAPAPATRQPVHTCYVSARDVDEDVCARWTRDAADVRARACPWPADLTAVCGVPAEVAADVHERLVRRLGGHAVDDLRTDFEDGYGNPDGTGEDADALRAGRALALLGTRPDAPLVTGVRIKSLHAATRARALRTLTLVVAEARQADAGWPRTRFVVTLPKTTHPAQVAAAAQALSRLETAYGLPAGCLRLEIQVELAVAVLAGDGRVPVPAMVDAAEGRCEGLHFGTYDFTAAMGVAATRQSLDHPLADHAKDLMQLAAAGAGTRVVDGSTNILPVGSLAAVRSALGVHARLVERGLGRGLHQGWDLHPGQLVSRYAVTFAFWRGELAAAGARLRRYVERTSGGTLDEPATARMLALGVLRGVDCGAVDTAEAAVATGMDVQALARLAGR